MKFKRVISIGLFVLVLAVWGSILYRVIAGIEPDEAMLAAASIDAGISPDAGGRARYHYAEDVRDPFERTPSAPEKASGDITVRRKKEPVVVLPPPYKLSGILCTKTRRVATLEATDGAVFFLSEKDTLDGIQILKIEPKLVLYLYRSQKMLWRLDGQD